MNAVVSANSHQITIEELLSREEKERGYAIQKLDSELLLKRVKDGGQSGDFLAKAFLSAYDMSPFKLSLGQLIKIDSEGKRLFQQILHIRNVPGWSDLEYNEIAGKIDDLLAKERLNVPSISE